MNKITILAAGLVAALLLYSPQNGLARNQKLEPEAIKIRISVIAPKNIKELISSYMTRELRQLGNVAIVDHNPDWHLAVTAVELKNNRGIRTGVALSLIISTPLTDSFVKPVIKAIEKETSLSRQTEILNTTPLSIIRSNWLRVDSDNEIKKLCQGIVADFDTEYLEVDRKNFQRLREKTN